MQKFKKVIVQYFNMKELQFRNKWQKPVQLLVQSFEYYKAYDSTISI